MDKSKVLIACFVAAILISVFFTYRRSFVARDFLVVPEETAGEENSEE